MAVSNRVGQIAGNRTLGRATGVVALLIGWQAIASVFPAALFPYPAEIAVLIWELFQQGVVVNNVWVTLYRTVLGFLASTIVGVFVGVLLGINRTTQKWMIPHLLLGLSISGLSSAAVAFLVFGFSILTPVLATTIAVFPYIAVNVWKGVEAIDGDLVEMSQSFGVSRLRTFFRLIIPNTAPSLFAAYRFGLATSWKIVTVVEVFGSSEGVGHKLIQAYTLQEFSKAWAWGIIFMIVVLIIEYALIKPIERRAFEYRPDADLTF